MCMLSLQSRRLLDPQAAGEIEPNPQVRGEASIYIKLGPGLSEA